VRGRIIALIVFFSFVCGLSLRFIPGLLSDYTSNDRELCLSKIVESDRLDDVKNYLGAESALVIFDIDNTLAAPPYEIGTDQWFAFALQKKQAEGASITEALKAVLPLYYQIHCCIPLCLIEETIPELFQMLCNQEVPVIALTARSDVLKQCTIKQLTGAGICLPFIGLSDCELRVTFEVPSTFTQGIIFCGKNDKGKVLFHMLDQVNYKPTKIIFVDDKYSNLASVERVCIQHKIPFIGIRYSRLDDRVSQFDPVKAEQELQSVMGRNFDESMILAQEQVGVIY